jgi:glucosamine kinase
MDLVVGVDVGATSTRSVLATTDGQVIGRGRAGGANPNSAFSPVRGGGGAADGGADLVETLERALGAALGDRDPSVVRRGVLGAAGSGGAGRRVFGTAAAEAWRTVGLPGVPVTVTDLEVAFAAGTWAKQGALLLSGTGALAARFDDGVLTRRCDGYGWLLGDEGSAVWIALRALRATLAALDGRGPATSLLEAARVTFGIPHLSNHEDVAQAILADAFRRPPAELGRLAPSVSAAAADGDRVAGEICADAAARLLHTFASVEPPAGGAVVLAGSVLLAPGPISRAVRDGLPGEPAEARDGAAGAATMAIAELTGAPTLPGVHARLTGHEPSRE